jgi:glycosyltransferase involved in cell wall biosynthesis
MKKPRRILTIGHPYALHALRRLPNEMAKAGGDAWSVLAVGPAYYEGSPKFGDLEPAHLIVEPGEAAQVAGMPMYLTHNVHLAFWGDAVRRLLREDFDVVHCWDEPFNPLCAQIARLAPKTAAFAFYTFQNIDKRYPPPFDRLERYTLGRSDGWIAAGSLVEKNLKDRPGYRDRPSAILGLGVDIEQFKPDPAARADVRAALGWTDDAGGPIVGYVGRFTEAKGLKFMMRALDRIAKPWRALFIGSGELEPEIEAWSQLHPGRVATRRNLPHAQVARHLAACDVLCAPSQTTPIWKEQFGRMLVEAFACGVPVVTSDSGEIPYVVGDAAIVVPERDDDGWHAALASTIADPALRADLGMRGLERVRQKFAWGVLANAHLAFFEEIADRRASRA